MTGHHSLRVRMPLREPPLSDGMHRRDDRPPPRWPVAAVAAFTIVAVLTWGFATVSTSRVEAERNAAVAQAHDLGRDVAQACARGDIVQTPTGRDLCQRAAQAQSAPVPTPAQGQPGRPPTLAEISAAVEAYCAARNSCSGRAPSTAEVAAAVAEHLTANPPSPGRPPTAAEIAAAVATWFEANPPPAGPQGKRGPRGERGPGPTREEIEAAVAAHLAANPPRPGPTCPEGTTLEPVLFASGEAGLGCVNEQQPPPTTAPTTVPPTTAPPTTGSPDPEGEGGASG